MLQGTLSARSGVADVIRIIYPGRRSGVLTVERDDVVKSLYFDKGSFSFSDTNQSGWRLGELLVARGVLAQSDLDDVLVLTGKGRRIGKVLTELELVSEVQLIDCVRYQILENVYPVFGWASGRYRFEERDKPVPEDIALALSTANVVMEGVRRIEDAELVRTALGSTSKIVVLGSNPLLRFQAIFLKPKEGFILSRIDGLLSIDEICSISPVPEEETLKCLYGLFAAGILELRQPEEQVSGEEEEQDIAGFFTELGGLEDVIQQDVPSGAVARELTAEERTEREEVKALYSRLEELSYEELLGIEPGAAKSAVRKAYYRLAKRFHPDRHHKSHLVEYQDQLEAIFVRVNDAYEKLREGSEAKPAAKPAASREPKPTESVTTTSAEDRAHRQQAAEQNLRQGLQLFESGDIFGAVQALRSAVQLEPERGRYQAALGRALARNPKWRREAEQHLLKAVELEPSNADHYAQLGRLYLSAGLLQKAERLVGEALKWDPTHELALASRDELEGRQDKDGGGLRKTFKSLFSDRQKGD